MKRAVYLKVSNRTSKMYVGIKNDFKALDNGYSWRNKAYPTVVIKLNLDIPDEFFGKAQEEIDLRVTQLNIASEIRVKEEVEDENYY